MPPTPVIPSNPDTEFVFMTALTSIPTPSSRRKPGSRHGGVGSETTMRLHHGQCSKRHPLRRCDLACRRARLSATQRCHGRLHEQTAYSRPCWVRTARHHALGDNARKGVKGVEPEVETRSGRSIKSQVA